MSLIDDYILPDEFLQLRLHFQHHFVGGAADIELLREDHLVDHFVLEIDESRSEIQRSDSPFRFRLQ